MTSTIARNREDRPFALTGGGGCGKELADKFKKRCLKNADRTFAQASQCQQINSIQAFISMEDAVFIIHSPVGCSGCVSFMNDLFKVGQYHRGLTSIRSARYLITNLDELDIIQGGEEKLRQAVLELEQRYHPKLIFIFTSCASAIIGDDVDSIAGELQNQVGAVIVPIHCEGFKSKVPATGFDTAFNALVKYVFKNEKPEREKGLINVFAPMAIGWKDQQEIERMLGVLGLKVNYFPFYSNLDKLKKIPAAEYSTSICQVFADEFMELLKRDYGIPYSKTGMPLGIRNTDEWLLGVARLVGKEEVAREYIREQHERVLPEIAKIKSRIQGKKVFICAGTARSFAAATLIDDFGLKLVGMQTPTYEEMLIEDFDKLIELHGDEFIVDVANMQPYEQANLVQRLTPDLFIGVSSWVAKQGITSTHVLETKRPTMGYNGILYLGNKIEDVIENPGFNEKLAKHKKLPYKESWYSESPFKFHKEAGD
ncbi:MAG: nifE1 [Firmicutes bacterium]|nr:nifE1 [Bacillota bacterium]